MLLKSAKTNRVYFVLKADWFVFPDGDKTVRFVGVGETEAEKEIFRKLVVKYFDRKKSYIEYSSTGFPCEGALVRIRPENFIFSRIFITQGTYSVAMEEEHARECYGDHIIDEFYRKLKES